MKYSVTAQREDMQEHEVGIIESDKEASAEHEFFGRYVYNPDYFSDRLRLLRIDAGEKITQIKTVPPYCKGK